MSRFRTLIPLICILMAAFLPTADARGETSLKLPDFAYPKTVEADATKALAQADAAAGDSGPTRLRALLELCAAQQTIDANSTFSQPAPHSTATREARPEQCVQSHAAQSRSQYPRQNLQSRVL